LEARTAAIIDHVARAIADLGGPNGREGPRVEELWPVYLEKHVRKNLEENGQRVAEWSWNNLRPFFGPLTVPQVTQDAVDEYESERLAGKIGRKAKSVSVRRELAYLIACLNFCAKRRKMFSPALIEPIGLPRGSPPRDRILSTDEIQRLLDAAAQRRRPDDRMTRGERFLWIALETAARKTAILRLTWSQVDFDAGLIHFNEPGRRVTKKRRATVPISSSLRPVLERALREHETEYVLDNPADSIWKTIQLAAIKAGFSDQTVGRGQKPKATGISPHVLRHTAATAMAASGVPLFQIATVLGNSLQVVEQVYAKRVPGDPTKTVDLISKGKLRPPK